MAGKTVAVIGDVQAEPAKDPTGTWGPAPNTDPIIYQAYNHLTVGKKAVIYSASCTFIFTPNQNIPPKPPETVILSAGATVLQGGKNHVLVNGDSATGEVAGNQLRVISSNNQLRSA